MREKVQNCNVFCILYKSTFPPPMDLYMLSWVFCFIRNNEKWEDSPSPSTTKILFRMSTLFQIPPKKSPRAKRAWFWVCNSTVCLHICCECQLYVYIQNVSCLIICVFKVSCLFTFVFVKVSCLFTFVFMKVSCLFTCILLMLAVCLHFWPNGSQFTSLLFRRFSNITFKMRYFWFFSPTMMVFRGSFFFWKPIKLMQKWKVSGKLLASRRTFYCTITGQKLQVILKKG